VSYTVANRFGGRFLLFERMDRNMRKQASGIILSSVTYAFRAKEILLRYNIKSQCEKLPASVTGCGCGYGLRVYSDEQTARALLETEGIQVKGSYLPPEGGGQPCD